jgi:hypothetical protein
MKGKESAAPFVALLPLHGPFMGEVDAAKPRTEGEGRRSGAHRSPLAQFLEWPFQVIDLQRPTDGLVDSVGLVPDYVVVKSQHTEARLRQHRVADGVVVGVGVLGVVSTVASMTKRLRKQTKST